MGEIAHPETGDSIEVEIANSEGAPSASSHGEDWRDDGVIAVEIIDSASHNGDYVQVQAVEDGIELSDESGNAPWLALSEVSE
jgi:hypothetical protein